jgi:hypothetical protein
MALIDVFVRHPWRTKYLSRRGRGMKAFRDYKSTMAKQITFVDGEFYPDYLDEAKALYHHIYEKFGIMAGTSKSSSELLVSISKITDKSRIQLLRLFRLFISPDTSVEMLKQKTKIPQIIKDFESRFRKIDEVIRILKGRGKEDETLYAILYEYKDRGQKGYELTEKFFTWFDKRYSKKYNIEGPIRAGADVILSRRLKGYPHDTPADFLISDKSGNFKIVGFARYDSDRGGAQEDDRTSGNQDKITHLKKWCKENRQDIKVVFLNDGPGLLLGSMWEDYSKIEESWPDFATVLTLKMLDTRFPLVP